MIRLPRVLTDLNFKKKIQRGTVLKTRLIFEDGTSKQKRIICLNKSLDKNFYFVKGTSQTQHLNNPILRANHVFVYSYETPAFEVDTIIDLRKVYEEDLNCFMERFRKGKLNVLGNVTQSILDKMDSVISASVLIELRIKKMIL